MVVKPYREHVTGNVRVRWFGSDNNDPEMVWHRDRSDRVVRVLKGTGWKIQFDNELPQSFDTGTIMHINKHEYHRVIRGHGPLVIEIVEE
jgi:hypothetical protein